MTLRDYLIEVHRDKLIKASVAIKVAAVSVDKIATKIFKEVTK
jgi:hypothetical protein